MDSVADAILQIGGFAIGLSGEGLDQIPESLQRFRVGAATVHLSCEGTLGPVTAHPARMLFDSGGIWQVDDAGDGAIDLILRREADPKRPYQRLRLSADLRRGEARLDPRGLPAGDDRFPLRAPMFELWTNFYLLRGHGVIAHGCGLLREGRVSIFVGESGAGKSTLAGILSRNSAGTILSDDRLIIRPEAGGFRVYGTPWHGEARFADPGDGTLDAVYFLEHADTTRLDSLSAAEAASRLAAVFFMACWPREGVEQVLEFGVRLASAIPCHRLRFRPDESVLAALGLEP